MTDAQSRTRNRWFAAIPLAACLLAGCGDDPSPADAVISHDTGPALPDCAQPGTLYGIGLAEMPIDVTQGTELPITLGFQQFIFVRVGLRAPVPLPGVVHLKIHITLDGTNLAANFSTVKSHPLAGGGAETTDVPLFFNDTTQAELVGRTAHLQISASTGTCTMRAAADVLLTVGDLMAADAGFWNESDTSP